MVSKPWIVMYLLFFAFFHLLNLVDDDEYTERPKKVPKIIDDSLVVSKTISKKINQNMIVNNDKPVEVIPIIINEISFIKNLEHQSKQKHDECIKKAQEVISEAANKREKEFTEQALNIVQNELEFNTNKLHAQKQLMEQSIPESDDKLKAYSQKLKQQRDQKATLEKENNIKKTVVVQNILRMEKIDKLNAEIEIENKKIEKRSKKKEVNKEIKKKSEIDKEGNKEVIKKIEPDIKVSKKQELDSKTNKKQELDSKTNKKQELESKRKPSQKQNKNQEASKKDKETNNTLVKETKKPIVYPRPTETMSSDLFIAKARIPLKRSNADIFMDKMLTTKPIAKPIEHIEKSVVKIVTKAQEPLNNYDSPIYGDFSPNRITETEQQRPNMFQRQYPNRDSFGKSDSNSFQSIGSSRFQDASKLEPFRLNKGSDQRQRHDFQHQNSRQQNYPQHVQNRDLPQKFHNQFHQNMQRQDFQQQDFQQHDFQLQKQDQRHNSQRQERDNYQRQNFHHFKPQEIQRQDFQRHDFQRQDFQQKNFQQKNFKPQEIQRQDFRPQEIQRQDFQQQEIQRQDFQRQEIQRQDFQRQEIQRQNLQQKDFQTQETPSQIRDIPLKKIPISYIPLPPFQQLPPKRSSLEQYAEFCKQKLALFVRFDKEWNFNYDHPQNREKMELTAYYVVNTFNMRTGNVHCLTCKITMEIGAFEQHTTRFGHSKFDETKMKCLTCSKVLNSKAECDEHEKHNEFQYEYLEGVTQCYQCSRVLKPEEKTTHYDEHFQKNNIVKRNWNLNKSQWLNIETKMKPHIQILPEIISEPLISIFIGRNENQQVCGSRLYYPDDTSLNKIFTISEPMTDVIIPSKTDGVEKCLLCAEHLKLWSVNSPVSGHEFAYLDVIMLNNHLTHRKCFLASKQQIPELN